MTYTPAQLIAAQDYVAAMVADRADGEVFLPIFEMLEAEIAAIAAKESAIDRARRITRERVAQAAA